MILKMVRADRSVLISSLIGFAWKPEIPHTVVLQDTGAEDQYYNLIEDDVSQLFIYSGDLVIFSLDVATGGPVAGYSV